MIAGCGWSGPYVIDLDLISFGALSDRISEARAIMQTEQAWTLILAAQGTPDSMKEWIQKRWPTGVSKNEQKSDVAEFLKLVAKGF